MLLIQSDIFFYLQIIVLVTGVILTGIPPGYGEQTCMSGRGILEHYINMPVSFSSAV